jgi:membrane protein
MAGITSSERERAGRNFGEKVRRLYHRINDGSAGMFDLLRRTFQRMARTRATEAAATLAYFEIFSLFPLLLALIAAASLVMERQDAFRQVVDFIGRFIPVSQALIEQNVQRVLQLRGPVGIVGLVGLLWSGTGFFNVLVFHVGQAWPETTPRSLFRRRLVALAMIGVMAILLLLSLIGTTAVRLASCEQAQWLGVGQNLCESLLWAISGQLVPWGLTFLALLALYRWVPRAEVPWPAAIGAGAAAAVLWHLVTAGFTCYLGSGWVDYELVYGSLGAVVALLFWMYFSNAIVVFGAYLSASIAGLRTELPAEGEPGVNSES